MKTFLISDEQMIREEQVTWLNTTEDLPFFPCSRIRFNDHIKLAFVTEGYVDAQRILPEMTLDEAAALGRQLLARVEEIESALDLTPENVVWDVESIFIHKETGRIRLIYLPVESAEEAGDNGIYVRRIYALLEDFFRPVEGGETVIRQMEHQQACDPGDWDALREALDKRVPKEDDVIFLRSVNAPEPLLFEVGHGLFSIGSDADKADGVIADPSIDEHHAIIGWNEISFFVTDLETENGTYLNGTRIASGAQIPFGKGSRLQFADFVFVVE